MSDDEFEYDDLYEVDSEDEDVEDEDDFVNNAYYKSEVNINGHDKDEDDLRDEKADDDAYGLLDENEAEKPQEEDDEDEEVVEDKTKSKVVPNNLRRTNPVMTKFEYSYLISQRAISIENNSPLMIPDTKFIHAVDIAKEELEKGVNPIIIRRILPNGAIEEWKCNELRLPKKFVN